LADRDVWSHGSGQQLQDLLGSALITLMLPTADSRPVYLASPWMSDFVVFNNAFRQVVAMFPALAERSEIRLSDYLLALGTQRSVRIITTHTATSDAFTSQLRARLAERPESNVQMRFASSEAHEKGILAPSFYISGSMNITHNGVYVKGEKLTYHAAAEIDENDRVARAYHEFDRQWALLAR
jgi:hypothetical protein